MSAAPLLFVVPARGGSRRVAGKNLRVVGGMSLVGRAIRTARAAADRLPDGPHVVACSTDDEAIAAEARRWGAVVVDRPAALASDDATSLSVVLHALDVLGPGLPGGRGFGAVVLVQPTSPLLEPGDIVECVEAHGRTGRGATTVVASHPAAWHHEVVADGTLRAPDSRASLLLTGGCYVASPEALRAGGRFADEGTTPVEVPQARAVDVDEELDIAVAEAAFATRPVPVVEVGPHRIGDGSVFVIAEAGVNHNGDVDLALALVDAAADAGADAVKFQTFRPDALAADRAPTARYQREAGVEASGQRAMLEALCLPDDAWPVLRARAEARGLLFMSTPFDDESAALLDDLGVPAFKVGSGELTNLPFLRRLARRGRPLLVSTGMADIVEVAAAVDAIRGAGDPPLALLHCVSSYPAAPGDANLRAIASLRHAFGVPSGWSDHTPGLEITIAAAALGADLVEKHLTLDRSMQGPDHRASLEPADFSELVRSVRAVEAARGTGVKAPVPAEQDVRAVARRSLHWARPGAAGHVVEEADLAVLRPGTGIAPGRLDALVGRPLARDVEAGAMVEPADLALDDEPAT